MILPEARALCFFGLVRDGNSLYSDRYYCRPGSGSGSLQYLIPPDSPSVGSHFLPHFPASLTTSSMRIACLQFAPQVGDVDNNLNRADAVLAKANQDDIDSLDLLVLPELAFSGTDFPLVFICYKLSPITVTGMALKRRALA